MSEFDEIASKYDYDTRLDIAAWVISKIDEHGMEGGSFRTLIYARLGFGPDAYVPLYEAGGMNISNELDYDAIPNIRKIVEEEKIDNVKLKRAVGACDEPDCYAPATCGWPAGSIGDGYRNTCYQHSNFEKYKPK